MENFDFPTFVDTILYPCSVEHTEVPDKEYQETWGGVHTEDIYNSCEFCPSEK